MTRTTSATGSHRYPSIRKLYEAVHTPSPQPLAFASVRVRYTMAVLLERIGSLSSAQLSEVLTRIALIILAFISIIIVYNTLLHPLRKVPGPRLARVTGLWRTARYFGGSWLDDIA